MDFIRKRPEQSFLIALIVGLVIGLIFAWGIWPVQWTNGQPKDLAPEYKTTYIETTAIAYSTTGNVAIVNNAFRDWPEASNDICTVWSTSTDPTAQAAIDSMVAVLQPGQNCTSLGFAPPSGEPLPPGTEPAPPPTEEGGTNIMVVLLLFLLLLVLVGAIYYVIKRRNEMMADDDPVSRYELPDDAPESVGDVDAGVTAVPIAKFTSSYSYGRDNYDDSFGIENTDGDFLGECGVGISESIGTNAPKNITAFEVWLFDKNDIRTETKVLMSDHAFFDEALKAKLAPKGEPVLARENEVIVLETAALIINATVKDMQYGTSDLPPQSYFESLTLEISAWAKESGSDSYADDDDLTAQDDADILDYN